MMYKWKNICAAGIVIVLFLVFMGNVKDYMPWNRKKAEEIAKQYLKVRNTGEQVEFLHIRIPVVDSVVYHVYFQGCTTNIIFEVIVPTDFDISRCSDNYVKQYLANSFYKDIETKMDKIWNNNTEIYLLVHDINNLPVNNEEWGGIERLAEESHYAVKIKMGDDISSHFQERIFETIQVLQNSIYNPKYLVFEGSKFKKNIRFEYEEWTTIKNEEDLSLD